MFYSQEDTFWENHDQWELIDGSPSELLHHIFQKVYVGWTAQSVDFSKVDKERGTCGNLRAVAIVFSWKFQFPYEMVKKIFILVCLFIVILIWLKPLMQYREMFWIEHNKKKHNIQE